MSVKARIPTRCPRNIWHLNLDPNALVDTAHFKSSIPDYPLFYKTVSYSLAAREPVGHRLANDL
jgi:hypothetical protein